jgi:hypothetical protein
LGQTGKKKERQSLDPTSENKARKFQKESHHTFLALQKKKKAL